MIEIDWMIANFKDHPFQTFIVDASRIPAQAQRPLSIQSPKAHQNFSSTLTWCQENHLSLDIVGKEDSKIHRTWAIGSKVIHGKCEPNASKSSKHRHPNLRCSKLKLKKTCPVHQCPTWQGFRLISDSLKALTFPPKMWQLQTKIVLDFCWWHFWLGQFWGGEKGRPRPRKCLGCVFRFQSVHCSPHSQNLSKAIGFIPISLVLKNVHSSSSWLKMQKFKSFRQKSMLIHI